MFDKDALDDANIRLFNDLEGILAALDIYEIVGFNARYLNTAIKCGNFFGHIQRQALNSFVIGVLKVYEVQHPKSKYLLGSIDGMQTLAKECSKSVDIKPLLKKYKLESFNDWKTDLDHLVNERRIQFEIPIASLKEVRDKRLAHTEQGVSSSSELPPISTLLDMLEFAEDFRLFINHQLLNIYAPSVLSRRHARQDTIKLLKLLGLSDIKLPAEPDPVAYLPS